EQLGVAYQLALLFLAQLRDASVRGARQIEQIGDFEIHQRANPLEAAEAEVAAREHPLDRGLGELQPLRHIAVSQAFVAQRSLDGVDEQSGLGHAEVPKNNTLTAIV